VQLRVTKLARREAAAVAMDASTIHPSSTVPTDAALSASIGSTAGAGSSSSLIRHDIVTGNNNTSTPRKPLVVEPVATAWRTRDWVGQLLTTTTQARPNDAVWTTWRQSDAVFVTPDLTTGRWKRVHVEQLPTDQQLILGTSVSAKNMHDTMIQKRDKNMVETSMHQAPLSPVTVEQSSHQQTTVEQPQHAAVEQPRHTAVEQQTAVEQPRQTAVERQTAFEKQTAVEQPRQTAVELSLHQQNGLQQPQNGLMQQELRQTSAVAPSLTRQNAVRPSSPQNAQDQVQQQQPLKRSMPQETLEQRKMSKASSSTTDSTKLATSNANATIPTSSSATTNSLTSSLSHCPLCDVRFPPSASAMDINAHMATCLHTNMTLDDLGADDDDGM
jgi:hypothetical protein